jgi:hypothetical protein
MAGFEWTRHDCVESCGKQFINESYRLHGVVKTTDGFENAVDEGEPELPTLFFRNS